MFNTFGKTSTTFGASVPVWREVDSIMQSGGTLGILPEIGGILPAGTPVVIDAVGGTVLPIYFAVVSELAASGASAVKIEAGENNFLPEVGDKLTVYTSGGQELTISEVGEAAAGVITLTTNGLLGDIAAGATLYLSERDSKDIDIAKLAGLTYNDVYAETGTTAASVAIVQGGTVYADRVPLIPANVKSLIPNIIFEGGI